MSDEKLIPQEEPIIRKKNSFKRLKGAIFEETVSDIKDYVIMDLIVPRFRDGINGLFKNALDIMGDSIEAMIYGKGAPRTRSSSSTGHIDYRGISDGKKPQNNQKKYVGYDDILFPSRARAMQTLDDMLEILDKYKKVRLADYYESADSTGNGYTDNDYGWTNLEGVKPVQVSGGRYILSLPKPVPLDND